ncbi:MAG: sn-glycerol-3-phosphate ABC transporter ATP-binding protein UgpC [Acuticoccus sp.]
MAVVTLENLSKRYDATSAPAVDAISLDIADGEFMVLLGPSGCGKSTTLRMIAGLEKISGGGLSIDGARMNDVPAKDRDIAMVFQSYALYPHMSVRKNLAFGLRRRGFDRKTIDGRVSEAARMLGLSDLLERKPHALSGGQRQRVALGRAVVRDPKVFLFDEPLSNLDAALRVSTRGELIKQHQRLGTTMIYVTHDQVEAMTMGTRICIMNGGQIAQVGAPIDVYRNPADTFVARFLGSPGTNLVPGNVSGANGGRALMVGAAQFAAPASADALGEAAVTVGIRPEDLYEPAGLTPGLITAPMSGTVTAVEPLGAETLLLLQPDGLEEEIVARVGRDSAARAGDRVTLHIDLSAVRLFDPSSGRAITRPGA